MNCTVYSIFLQELTVTLNTWNGGHKTFNHGTKFEGHITFSTLQFQRYSTLHRERFTKFVCFLVGISALELLAASNQNDQQTGENRIKGKKGNAADANIPRPIAITATMNKITKTVVKSQIVQFLRTQGVLNKHQHAFINKHSHCF
jgi:hypothetical protein